MTCMREDVAVFVNETKPYPGFLQQCNNGEAVKLASQMVNFTCDYHYNCLNGSWFPCIKNVYSLYAILCLSFSPSLPLSLSLSLCVYVCLIMSSEIDVSVFLKVQLMRSNYQIF